MKEKVILTHPYLPEAEARLREEFNLVPVEGSGRTLAEKLEKNELFSAGLDVYEFEPQVTEKLKKLKNAVLVPHIGSATHYARLEMAMMTIRSVEQALSGQRPALLIPGWR